MITRIDSFDPDHGPVYINEEGEEVCPLCEYVIDHCICQLERGDDGPPSIEDEEGT